MWRLASAVVDVGYAHRIHHLTYIQRCTALFNKTSTHWVLRYLCACIVWVYTTVIAFVFTLRRFALLVVRSVGTGPLCGVFVLRPVSSVLTEVVSSWRMLATTRFVPDCLIALASVWCSCLIGNYLYVAYVSI